jgi:hypothetical protein
MIDLTAVKRGELAPDADVGQLGQRGHAFAAGVTGGVAQAARELHVRGDRARRRIEPTWLNFS